MANEFDSDIIFYKNYDYGCGETNSGPGTGLYQNMEKYKSVDDFLKRKRLRKKNRMNRRKKLLTALCKKAIDFQVDEQIKSSPIVGDSGTYSDSVYIGGIYDKGLSYNDFEGKGVDQLNFGRDYTEDEEPDVVIDNKALLPREIDFYGLQDGIFDKEDLEEINYSNPYYGILGNNRL